MKGLFLLLVPRTIEVSSGFLFGAMAPFEITVRGTASIPHKAERAIIDVQITHQGNDRSLVVSEVAQSSHQLQALLKDLSASLPPPPISDPDTEATTTATGQHSPVGALPPLAKWNMDSFTTTSHLPRDENHNVIKDAARIYTTTVPFRIQVQDFDALSGLISKLSTSIPHVYVKNIRWTLTESTQKAFESELRRLAAVDAAERAKDYAGALGMSAVKPVHLNEDEYGRSGHVLSDRMYTGRGGPDDESVFDGIEFVPEEIRMEKSVEAKFQAE